MNKKLLFVLLISIVMIFSVKANSKAGIYDNAYTYYTQYGSDSSTPARFNSSDGYIYFCSKGLTSTTQTRYRTVGYSITVTVGRRTDTIEVMLDGSYVKNVSVVSKNDYTYVLRRAKLTKLLSLFNGNNLITWNEIYCRNNTYTFNAIMTVVESGKVLCGNVYEESGYRTISADNNKYLFRKLSAIQSARKWANPKDLETFFDKTVSFPAKSNINLKNAYITGENVYFDSGIYYVKPNANINISAESYFADAAAANEKYHPNFNIYSVTGWGDNIKIGTRQKKTGGKGYSYEIKSGTGLSKPLLLKGTVDAETFSYSDSNNTFKSTINCTFNVPDSKEIFIKSEGRVYYNYNYPDNLDFIDYLCDKKIGTEALDVISDGTSPEVYVPDIISTSNGNYIPVSATDYCSGIRSIKLVREDNTIISQRDYDNRRTVINLDKELNFNIKDGNKYYVIVIDNVGNVARSKEINIFNPTAHSIKTYISGHTNGYNADNIAVDVYGGNQEIEYFKIVSTNYNTPNNRNITYVNKSVSNGTLNKGIYSYHYSFDPKRFLSNFPDGTYVIDVMSGSKDTEAKTVSIEYHKDSTKPNINVRDTFDQYTWYNTDIMLEFEGSDSYSGIDEIKALIDKEQAEGSIIKDIFMGYTLGRYNITGEGIHLIEMKAKDRAGNINTRFISCKIDETPPDIVFAGAFAGKDLSNDKWISRIQCKSPIYFFDDLSGLSLNTYDHSMLCEPDLIDEDEKSIIGYLSDEYVNNLKSGSYVNEIFWKDNAGNKREKRLYLNVDCDNPIIKPAIVNGWSSDELKGEFDVKDEHSGISEIVIIKNGETVKTISNINKNDYKLALDFSSESSNPEVIIRVTDVVGNTIDYAPDTNKLFMSLRASVERLGDPTSSVFKKGEKGALRIVFAGDADYIQVRFPEIFTNIDMNNNKDFSVKGSKSIMILHKVPIYLEIPENIYEITVTAVKDTKSLTVKPTFQVVGNVLDDFRTRLRY